MNRFQAKELEILKENIERTYRDFLDVEGVSDNAAIRLGVLECFRTMFERDPIPIADVQKEILTHIELKKIDAMEKILDAVRENFMRISVESNLEQSK